MTSSIRWPRNASTFLFSLCAATALAAAPVSREVRERLHDAQKEYSIGHFQEALTLFSDVYEHDPLPGILFNIAQCHRQLGNWERAAFFYRRYLSLSTTRPKNAAEAEALLAEVEQKQAEAEKKKQEEDAAKQRQKDEELARQNAQRSDAPVAGFQPLPMPPMTTSDGSAVAPAGTATAEASNDSVLKKWWFWAGVGAIAAAATITIYAGVSSEGHGPGTLPTIIAK